MDSLRTADIKSTGCQVHLKTSRISPAPTEDLCTGSEKNMGVPTFTFTLKDECQNPSSILTMSRNLTKSRTSTLLAKGSGVEKAVYIQTIRSDCRSRAQLHPEKPIGVCEKNVASLWIFFTPFTRRYIKTGAINSSQGPSLE